MQCIAVKSNLFKILLGSEFKILFIVGLLGKRIAAFSWGNYILTPDGNMLSVTTEFHLIGFLVVN